LTPPVRDRDRRTPRGRTIHRRVQPPTPAQQLRDAPTRLLRGAARRASREHDPTGAGRLTESQPTRTLHDFGGSPPTDVVDDPVLGDDGGTPNQPELAAGPAPEVPVKDRLL